MQLIYRSKLLALNEMLCQCAEYYAISLNSLCVCVCVCVYIYIYKMGQFFSDDTTSMRFSTMPVHRELTEPTASQFFTLSGDVILPHSKSLCSYEETGPLIHDYCTIQV